MGNVLKLIGNLGKIHLRLPSHTITNPREFVLESAGLNKFYPHFRIWDGDHIPGKISAYDKLQLFDALFKALPEGGELLIPRSSPIYLATPGTVGAYLRFALDPRYTPGLPGSFLYKDKNGKIKVFQTTSFFKPRTSHLQGDEAIQMFKEYGGEAWPEGSINGEQLMKYVPEARERYGIVGRTDITDKEIAEALYKHVNELGGNTAAVNFQGEPQLLFRGDSRAYTELRPRKSPTEMLHLNGTMDNSLGTLFLGELPKEGGGDQGVLKYLNSGIHVKASNGFPEATVFRPSQTGGSLKFDGKTWNGLSDFPSSMANNTTLPVIIPEDASHMYSLKGILNIYKLPSRMSTSGVNEINGFITRTPFVRNVTNEMQVLEPQTPLEPTNLFHWLTAEKPILSPTDSEGNTGLYKGKPFSLSRSGSETGVLRELWSDQYAALLDEAEKQNLGLLYSEPETIFRREHFGYPYYVVPNFNIQNTKHILPYDLRIPRNWKDTNIFRTLAAPIVLGTGLYLLNNNGSTSK